MSEHTKPTMIQGTVSNAEKSILVAGLCRIFYQDGYRAAPSKSQGMALNPYITPEGLEIGRTQAIQAGAAGIVSHTDMNPILLKPTTDVGSRVIVHGISRGDTKARDYLVYKKSLVPDIMVSYRRLEEQCDVIVIEGAGGPAEINLKSYDIVNMGMADMADALALPAGDIDRGGVFAQLCDTVSLPTEEERKWVKGLTINKLRGDRSILKPGIPMLEALCHIPVVGVIPYVDVNIEDKDSLSSRLETDESKAPAAVDLAAIRFSCISNFTDFNAFSGTPGVSLRHVTEACDPGSLDMVIPLGTKNTIQDLLWTRQNGLEVVTLKLVDRQVPVWGIYGGHQMMGKVLEDAVGVESDLPSRTAGMGLLLLRTEFEEEETRTRVEGALGELDGCLCGLSGKSTEGYEIHTGRTYIDREEGAVDTAKIVSWRREPEMCCPTDYVMEMGKDRILSRQARMDGWSRGNIYDTYVHGIFNSPQIARTAAEALAAVRGLCLEQVTDIDYCAYREQQYDKLAESLREHLNTDAVYRIMGISLKEKREGEPDDGYTVGTGIAGRY